ncbi:hypothetical protein C0J52_09419, partial [Blattella germanica]
KAQLKITFAEEGEVDKDDIYRRVRRSSLPEVVNQKEIITLIKKEKELGFLYMIYAVSRASEFYSPYCLTVVPYEMIDRTNFITISRCGVTQYYPGDMVFTPLDVWEREYDYYCKLIDVSMMVMPL